MATKRESDSTLSGSPAIRTGSSSSIPGSTPGDRPLNPGILPEEVANATHFDRSSPPPARETRGSGSDRGSDSSRLKSREALLDKTDEDSFPASDPPSSSPITGFGRANDASVASIPRMIRTRMTREGGEPPDPANEY